MALGGRALVRLAAPVSASGQGLCAHAGDGRGLHLVAFAALMFGRLTKILLVMSAQYPIVNR